MQNFFKRNWTLLVVILYIILPDLFVGPFDDLGLLVAERLLTGYLNKKREQKQQKSNSNET